MNLTHFHPKSI